MNSQLRRYTGVITALFCAVGIAQAGMQATRDGEAAGLTAVPERVEIFSGEPLVLHLSISNPSDKRLVVAMDSSWIERVTTDDDGRRTRWPTHATSEDPLVFSIAVDPHQSRELRLAAVETASLRKPGHYTISITIRDLRLSVTTQFTVLPYDASELKARAEEFATQAVRLNDLEAAKALNAMPGSIGEPYICLVMKANVGMLSLGVPRLEELHSAESAACLIDLMPRYKEPYRSLVAQALRRLESTANPELRMKIDRVLAAPK
ncbi:MAG: hypothetical protein JO340_19475 [Acidobacteriaceae bacterium]|nr:hypothetical protein [Acidobacteriaceae bacterium]